MKEQEIRIHLCTIIASRAHGRSSTAVGQLREPSDAAYLCNSGIPDRKLDQLDTGMYP